jgi:release factor glutamine methyltransferase
VAAADEAEMLLARAAGDGALLDALVARRLAGEPLAWITGTATFCDLTVGVDAGVYVPRPHTEQLALRAAERLPPGGVAVDVCTGSGAVAMVLAARRPGARVFATDVDAGAVACATRNGVEALQGDLFAPLPANIAGTVDVVTGVVPYVPTGELGLLQRDTFTFESAVAYDGGPDGGVVLRRVIAESPRVLRPRGALLLELGGDQAGLLAPDLARQGYAEVRVLRDADGDIRGIEATRT